MNRRRGRKRILIRNSFPRVAFWQRQPERKNSGTIRRTLVENRPM